MFVLKDFVRDCFIAQICAKMCLRAGICAYLRDEAILNKVLGYEHWRYPKEHAHQFTIRSPRRARGLVNLSKVTEWNKAFPAGVN